jgi:hypothetical protein
MPETRQLSCVLRLAVRRAIASSEVSTKVLQPHCSHNLITVVSDWDSLKANRISISSKFDNFICSFQIVDDF